jgi:FkbM family methyltransferase
MTYSKMNSINKIISVISRIFKPDSHKLFKSVSGIIHVGANEGQEREIYARFLLPVIWVEPNPEVYEILEKNIKELDNQKAIKGLVTDLEGKEYEFHLANNKGESSSILDFNLHKEVWPDVAFEKSITLISDTLPSLLEKNKIDPSKYDMLVMDTQGSELLVLKGSESILQNFKYIKTEVPDFESYKDCCQLKDIESFLSVRGYKEFAREPFARRPGGGTYYDITYKKIG